MLDLACAGIDDDARVLLRLELGDNRADDCSGAMTRMKGQRLRHRASALFAAMSAAAAGAAAAAVSKASRDVVGGVVGGVGGARNRAQNCSERWRIPKKKTNARAFDPASWWQLDPSREDGSMGRGSCRRNDGEGRDDIIFSSDD